MKEDKDAPGKDDIEVKLENVEKYLGAPALCKIYIARPGTTERPSLFWRFSVGGSGAKTDSVAKANVQMWQIKSGPIAMATFSSPKRSRLRTKPWPLAMTMRCGS